MVIVMKVRNYKKLNEILDIFFFTHGILRMLAMGHANDIGSDKDRF